MEQAGSKTELSFADYIWVTQINQKRKKKCAGLAKNTKKLNRNSG